MKIWRLSIGLWRTSSPSLFTLASWSYVTGYWRWCIYLNRRDQPSLNRFGWHGLYGRYDGWIKLPLIGTISIQTQPPMPAMKCAGGRR